jgi:hypothetical protein
VYNSYFELDVVNPTQPDTYYEDTYELIYDLIGKLSEEYANPLGNLCPWYDYEEVMAEVSQKFAGLVLIISGDGEDSDDKWREAWRNGKVIARWETPNAPNNTELLRDFAI